MFAFSPIITTFAREIPHYTTVKAVVFDMKTKQTNTLTNMKKSFYETPLCLSISLDTESKVMMAASQAGAGDFGFPGYPGNELDLLPPIIFE